MKQYKSVFCRIWPLAGPGSLAALVISLAVLSGSVDPVAAGTETGEWCLTCPDWNNFDAWSEWAEFQASSSNQPSGSDSLKNNSKIQDTNLEADNTTDPNDESDPEEDLAGAGSMSDFLVPISSVYASDLILDISPEADEYIWGAINVNYEDLLTRDARIKSASEIAEILGDAGISRDDSVVIYGECLPCGGGPVPATFTYWLLKYLGHDEVRILDGDVEDWKAAGLSASEAPATRPAADYMPKINPDLLATYDYVKSGKAQIVDVRVAEAADPASIPGSVNIPAEMILEGEKIKDVTDLEEIFRDLDKDRPVVVYTNTGVNAAVFWFALEMMGYDAMLYSWRDWLENQPTLDLALLEVTTDPNPVNSGESVRITVTFENPISQSLEDASEVVEPKLTVLGCVSCGFGSPQSFANLDTGSGVVHIGSSASKPSDALQDVLKCTAIISDRDGTEVGRANLLRTTGEKYVGVWDAGVDPGVYSLNILASRSGFTRYFQGVLDIEVADG
jgi:thiosulfate/3-mercaptopyruvate sulfurtransferase